ncbi:membrane protein FxsA [Tumebacillus sp. ITR2]|uniref:Membrane protein FxsA n=1 Tax=Tumebacillus amylolyticus TaxID=2801339 RepID=A0ABS1J7K4_9BACL|nr:FxsA family protein [Tumebacillus amylolyticus]MBL0386262.1 membrane protein FxsA [Tumebacillus amylolyticus]
MMRLLLVLVVVVPALEIFTMIQVGQVIGGWPTFFLIVACSFLGAYLLKTQGLRVWNQIRREFSKGMIPGEALLDGACVLVGGTLLLTPGFLTDVFGLFLLVPGLRNLFKPLLKVWLLRLLSKGRITYFR